MTDPAAERPANVPICDESAESPSMRWLRRQADRRRLAVNIRADAVVVAGAPGSAVVIAPRGGVVGERVAVTTRHPLPERALRHLLSAAMDCLSADRAGVAEDGGR